MTRFANSSTHVLITGGSNGIGRGLAQRFHAAGAQVIVTGRNQESLSKLAVELPGIRTIVSDIGDVGDREALAQQVIAESPKLNVIINNAGIQRRVALAEDQASWAERQAEIDILLAGPVHLNHLLIPHLLAHGKDALIVNVTSGGAFLPQPFAPLYSACKAALHSYTMNLRFALAGTPIGVVELIPPAVATGLAGQENSHGAPVDAFCDAVFPALASGEMEEVGYDMTASTPFEQVKAPSRAMFEAMAHRFSVKTYRDL